MPGFMIDTAGDGKLGGPAGNLEIRRAHRWVFTVLGPPKKENIMSARLVLKTASRPSVSFEEVEMDHNQEKVYLAGKHTWEPITLTFYDVEQDPDVSAAIYEWLEGGSDSVFKGLPTMKINQPSEYKHDAELAMINGQGESTEEWKLHQSWPSAVNWNALDYSSSELQLVEVTLRYDRGVKTK